MNLWLVRHAQVLLPPGICYGALDVAAEPQATQECVQALAKVLPVAATVHSSPLQRCTLLADHLMALRPDLTLQIDHRLQEMNFGDWEGRRWDMITQSQFDAWTRNFADHAVGGRGETVRTLMARVGQAFDELGSGNPAVASNDVVWITHAGIIRAAQLLAQGIRQVSQAGQWPVENTACGQWRTLTLA